MKVRFEANRRRMEDDGVNFRYLLVYIDEDVVIEKGATIAQECYDLR